MRTGGKADHQAWSLGKREAYTHTQCTHMHTHMRMHRGINKQTYKRKLTEVSGFSSVTYAELYFANTILARVNSLVECTQN